MATSSYSSSSSSLPILIDRSVGTHYFWQKLTDRNLILPPLQQRRNNCAVAATVRQLEYQVQCDLAAANLNLERELFDHEGWFEYLKTIEPRAISGEMGLTKGVKPGSALAIANRDGVTCHNGYTERINSYGCVIKNENGWTDTLKFQAIVSWLELGMPVVGVFNIEENYPDLAEKPYTLSEGHPYDPYDVSADIERHAIIIIGYYIAGAKDPYGLTCGGQYILYQESHGHGEKSVLKDGIGIVHPRYIVEAFYGRYDLPSLLLKKEQIRRKMVLREKEKTDRRRNHERSLEFLEKRTLDKKRDRLKDAAGSLAINILKN